MRRQVNGSDGSDGSNFALNSVRAHINSGKNRTQCTYTPYSIYSLRAQNGLGNVAMVVARGGGDGGVSCRFKLNYYFKVNFTLKQLTPTHTHVESIKQTSLGWGCRCCHMLMHRVLNAHARAAHNNYYFLPWNPLCPCVRAVRAVCSEQKAPFKL